MSFYPEIPITHRYNQCGIYCIRNTVNGKFYLGSSTRCYHRIKSQHLARLRNNTHNNPHLQASWNKYGESAFVYFVVEECSRNMLRDVEQRYLDFNHSTDPKVGYNINQRADASVLSEEQRRKISSSKLGKPRSTETKQKISDACKKRTWSNEQRLKFIASNSGKNHWNYGGHRTKEEREKISKSLKVSIRKWWKKRKENV